MVWSDSLRVSFPCRVTLPRAHTRADKDGRECAQLGSASPNARTRKDRARARLYGKSQVSIFVTVFTRMGARHDTIAHDARHTLLHLASITVHTASRHISALSSAVSTYDHPAASRILDPISYRMRDECSTQSAADAACHRLAREVPWHARLLGAPRRLLRLPAVARREQDQNDGQREG